MTKKQNKSTFILPIFFFLLMFLASGEDNSWIEMIVNSVIFSSVATFLSMLVYKFVIFLFNPARLINKQEVALIVDEILEGKESNMYE